MNPTLEKWNNIKPSHAMIEAAALEMYNIVGIYLKRQDTDGAYDDMMRSITLSFSTVHPALRDHVFGTFAFSLAYIYPQFDFKLFTQ
tara:strand:+ start:1227 stop:1487 length:261 start_codon:yes stop_codon:yes gene_type:complete